MVDRKMLNFSKNILTICAFTLIIHLSATPSVADNFESEIDKLFSLSETKSIVFKNKGIDIGIAALTLAKEIYPDLDIKAYSIKIDEMAANIREFTKGSEDPDYRIRALNTYLFKIEGIKYDLSDPLGKNIKNRYLNGVLDRKKGNCVSIPILYLTIAQRLGYPVYAVAAPDHLFLRYVAPNLKEQNIEPTGGGGYSSDEEYIKDFQISEQGIKSGTYLKTMTNRELLADLVAENAIYWANHGDIKRAIRYLERSIKASPNSAEINDSLGIAYLNYTKRLNVEKAEEYREKGHFYRKKAMELGLVRLPSADYIKQVQKKIEATQNRAK